jgi:TPR repeat protein
MSTPLSLFRSYAMLLLALAGTALAQQTPATERTFQQYKAEAEKGDLDAMHKLGWAYEHGAGTNRNLSEALRWYRRAADEGHAVSQEELGQAYLHGEGVAADPKEGVRWLEKAALQGRGTAQFALAEYYGGDLRYVTARYIEAYAWAHLFAQTQPKEAKSARHETFLKSIDNQLVDKLMLADAQKRLAELEKSLAANPSAKTVKKAGSKK